jgi:hypothetical protein
MPVLAEYAWKVFRCWWIVVPVVVGAIRLIEWIFRHSKPIPFFSPRVRWGIALAGICIAQFYLLDLTGKGSASWRCAYFALPPPKAEILLIRLPTGTSMAYIILAVRSR